MTGADAATASSSTIWAGREFPPLLEQLRLVLEARHFHDDSRVGAGFDVQVFDGRPFVFGQRCPLEALSRGL
jgi:hypothetical protein